MAHYWLYFLLGAWCFPALSCNPAKDASRIAVAGGSITEILYFLGEESKIIATDSTSTYPAGARLFP
jgi:iron complex transport system substrate-binding protein